MISLDQLQEDHCWHVVISPPDNCTQTRGDWRCYPHLSGAKMWREHMRPGVRVLCDFLEREGIYLECPIAGCNMQGSYLDHVTSTNGSHYRNLWQRGVPFQEGVPVEDLRDTAWEQRNIRGGAIRFNHVDWEVQLWRGAPPPGPAFGQRLSGVPPDSAGQPSAPPQVAGLPAQPRAGRRGLAELPEASRWFVLQEPASVATSASGDWRCLPHVVGGKRNWNQQMRGPATELARVMEAYRVPFYECSICQASRGWEEHIPGPQHFSRINALLGERPVAVVREEAWQQWPVRHNGVSGVLRFNHLDGEIQALRHGDSMPPRPPPPPPSAPSTSQAPPPRAADSVANSAPPLQPEPPVAPPRSAAPSAPGPASAPGTSQAPPPRAADSIAILAPPLRLPPPPPRSAAPSAPGPMPAPPPHQASWARLLWQRMAPEVALRLQGHLQRAEVPGERFTCRLCRFAPMSGGIEAHLRLDSHVENLAMTMECLTMEQWERAGGEDGPRVQKFEGRLGEAWLNHITGESGVAFEAGVPPGWELL